MKAGQFNINEYLERLYEEAGEDLKGDGPVGSNKEGLIIPEENKKSYNWLKKEYEKGKTEVKVEISMGGAKFEPGYDMQTNLDSVKDFKPGMYGEVKTAENPNPKKPASLDSKKDSETFGKGEGDAPKKELTKTKDQEGNIKNKDQKPVGKPVAGESKEKEKKEEHEAGESKEKEEKEEHEASETPEEEKKEEKAKGEKPEVKKIDLKTKKK